MRLLFLGDIVGKVGRQLVHAQLRKLQELHTPAFTIANGENASGGVGITPGAAEEIFGAGVDLITTGNHIWNRKEIFPFLKEERQRIIRPMNYPPVCPGSGWTIAGTIAVVNLVARVFMPDHADCPFRAIEGLLAGELSSAKIIFVDFHGEATSEKSAMAHFLDGRVSVLVGTHTHVQTADERVLPKGTAFISDVGMCGPTEGVIGMRADIVVERFRTGLPARFEVAKGSAQLNGVVVEIDEVSGRALGIRRINEVFGEAG